MRRAKQAAARMAGVRLLLVAHARVFAHTVCAVGIVAARLLQAGPSLLGRPVRIDSVAPRDIVTDTGVCLRSNGKR